MNFRTIMINFKTRFGLRKPKYKLVRGRLLGEGIEGKVTADTLKIRGKEVSVAVKRAHKGTGKYGIEHYFGPKTARKNLIRAKRVWRELKKAGLPVPSFFTINLRKKSRDHLSVIMEDLEAKHGKLLPINQKRNQATPTFLFNLRVEKDAKLIQNLARDLATIVSLGYYPTKHDFWHFYRKNNGELDRVIIDFTFLFKSQTAVKSYDPSKNSLRKCFQDAEFSLFYKAYREKLAEMIGQ